MNSFLSILLFIFRYAGGREGVKRFATVPEKQVRAACAKTGADPEEALDARDALAEATVAFVEQVAVPEDQEDDE